MCIIISFLCVVLFISTISQKCVPSNSWTMYWMFIFILYACISQTGKEAFIAGPAKKTNVVL
jgi:hypothetical protein